MWYQVPKDKPASRTEKPRPIFPWESQQSKPTRIFADEVHQSDPDPSTTEGSAIAISGETRPFLESNRSLTESQTTETSTQDEPRTPTGKSTPSDPWGSFTRINAWDDHPAIEKYVDSMPLFRKHRGSGSVAGLDASDPGAAEDSSARSQKDTTAGAEWRRRGSKLTDFPTAVDRPSLPVTPAPIRRPKFWGAGDPAPGDEDESDDALPAADGVPRQSEWVCEHGRRYRPGDCLCDLTNVYRYYKDPVARLQLLAQQQSELLLRKLGSAQNAENDNPGGSIGLEGHDIPNRSLPFGSDAIISPTYAARSASVHSPKPVKAPGVGPRGILDGSYDDNGANARVSESSAKYPQPPSSTVQEASYRGPGAAWDKDEAYPQRWPAMPPSEEEKDVLET